MAVAGVLSAKVSVVSVPEASGSTEVLTRSGYSVRVRKHFEATALLRLLTDPRRRLMLCCCPICRFTARRRRWTFAGHSTVSRLPPKSHSARTRGAKNSRCDLVIRAEDGGHVHVAAESWQRPVCW
jgi:hypothetical protein